MLEPTDIAGVVDSSRKLLQLRAHGAVEFNISPALVRAATSFSRRLAAMQGAGLIAHRRQVTPFAPFRLRNDTGTPLYYWVDGEHSPRRAATAPPRTHHARPRSPRLTMI